MRKPLRRFLTSDLPAPFLAVGTVEPRKNQSLLVEAFRILQAADPESRLLVLGAVGWQGQAVVDAMRQHTGRWGEKTARTSIRGMPRGWRPGSAIFAGTVRWRCGAPVPVGFHHGGWPPSGS